MDEPDCITHVMIVKADDNDHEFSVRIHHMIGEKHMRAAYCHDCCISCKRNKSQVLALQIHVIYKLSLL
jgi:hypothetical protein